MWMQLWGRLLGLSDVSSIESWQIVFAAPWARSAGLFWLIGAFLFAVVGTAAFYLRWQRGSLSMRVALATLRTIVFALLIAILADPVLQLTYTSQEPPVVALLLDGTESMAMIDQASESERRELHRALEIPGDERSLSRLDYLQAFLGRSDNNVLDEIRSKYNCQIEPFLFQSSGRQPLQPLSPQGLSEQLTATGKVTAIGDTLLALTRRSQTDQYAAVILASDFANNAGSPPLGAATNTEHTAIVWPVYTIGVGATSAIDLAVEVVPPPRIRRDQRASILVKWSQMGLEGRSATIRLMSRLAGSPSKSFAEQQITLSGATGAITVPFITTEPGRHEIIVTAEPLDGETLLENNEDTQSINVVDEFFRVLYVTGTPDWQWRFVKEVLYRDKAVGEKGFRTYLESADPRVRQSNTLFVNSIEMTDEEFFSRDVIILGDTSADSLTEKFCQRLVRFVSEFGGGLVVAPGPSNGLRQLGSTPIAQMLPVVPETTAATDPVKPFKLKLSPLVWQADFMHIGSAGDQQASREVWQSITPLSWYQRVGRLHPLAEVLAEHPTDRCTDGETPQPLIARRPFGRGEVIYLGTDELWRLRRHAGERYFRQFWSQIVSRLALSHALGSAKRFVARLDRETYRTNEPANISVEAFDDKFLPLQEPVLQMTLTASDDDMRTVARKIALPPIREGVYQSRFAIPNAGSYQLSIHDPVADQAVLVPLQVVDTSAETSSRVRNERIQQQIAAATGGQSYNLLNADRLIDDLALTARTVTGNSAIRLWTTPFWFMLVVGALVAEWVLRKTVNLL